MAFNLLDKGNPEFLECLLVVEKERPDVLPLISTAFTALRVHRFNDLDTRILVNPRHVDGCYYFSIGKDFYLSFKRRKSDDERYAYRLEFLAIKALAFDD